MKKKSLLILVAILLISVGVFLTRDFVLLKISETFIYPIEGGRQLPAMAAIVSSPFFYEFKVDGALHETNNTDKSSSPYWWLNSGGVFYLKDSVGATIQGELPTLNKWRLLYAASNPVDTDNGYHPQNILRIVTRSQWQDFQQEVYFRITKLNMSESPNQNASNGLLLFNRYQDGDNLYYTGIRVDGSAVIKKKINGKYYTLAYKKFYFADAPYNRNTNPNLIPGEVWIGMRSEVKTNANGTVSIKFFIDKNRSGNFELAAEAIDDGRSYGGAAITNKGYGGIRTDFMDVEFDDFGMKNI